MWIQFVLVCVVASLLLLVPGCLLLRALRMRWGTALSAAPAVSVCMVVVPLQLVSTAGVRIGTPVLVGLAVLLTAATIATARGLRATERLGADLRPLALAVTVGAGLAVGACFFLRGLPGPEAIYQAYDLPFHLNRIRALLDSQNYSLLSKGVYLAPGDPPSPLEIETGFYPSAWHIVCALAMRLTGAPVLTTVNAVNYVFAALVYPLCMLGLIAQLLGERPGHLVLVGCVAPAFAIFPWGFLIFGPIYPNLASFAVLPGAMLLFVLITRRGLARRQRVACGVALALALAAMALLQPNALFAMGMFFIPYVVARVRRDARPLQVAGGRTLGPTALAALAAVALAALWVVAVHLPQFGSVVNFEWLPFAGLWQEVVNIGSFSFLFLFYGDFARFVAQPVLTAFVLAGILRTLRERQNRWMVVSFLLGCGAAFCSATASAGLARRVFSGFWYTDPVRCAALVCLFAVPLAYLGADAIFGAVERLFAGGRRVARLETVEAGALVALVVLFGNYATGYHVPGFGGVQTPFGNYLVNVEGNYDRNAPLNTDERAFVQEVREVVPADAVIINDLSDGSILSYGVEGLRCYYRHIGEYGETPELAASVEIREHLNELASNAAVQDAVREVGASYLLKLDDYGRGVLIRENMSWLSPGIDAVNDDTPGFEVVLSRGRMRLYRMDV